VEQKAYPEKRIVFLAFLFKYGYLFVMKFSKEDKKRIKNYYRSCLRQYGIYSADALGWAGLNSQIVRFKALLKVGNLEGKRILDVGCGLGDLYHFLSLNYNHFEYLGIDLVPEFIEKAKIKYPQGDFLNKDILDFKSESFDFVLSSGAMTFKIPNYKEKYFEMIKKMFQLSSLGTAFNMLNKEGHVDDDLYTAYDIEEITSFCYSLTQKLKIIKDYSPQDFTVFLYR